MRIGFSPDYRECPPSSRLFQGAKKAGLFKLGAWGTEVHPRLAPQPGRFDIVKHRVSPFYATTLEPILRTLGTRRLVVLGVSTSGAVLSALKDGHDRDYAGDGGGGRALRGHRGAARGGDRTGPADGGRSSPPTALTFAPKASAVRAA